MKYAIHFSKIIQKSVDYIYLFSDISQRVQCSMLLFKYVLTILLIWTSKALVAKCNRNLVTVQGLCRKFIWVVCIQNKNNFFLLKNIMNLTRTFCHSRTYNKYNTMYTLTK